MNGAVESPAPQQERANVAPAPEAEAPKQAPAAREEKRSSGTPAGDGGAPTAVEPASAQKNAADAPAEERPRRRGRKPKAASAASEGADAAPAAKRRTRRAKTADAGAEKAPSAPISDEVAQARALAQVSQASVVRRQRRAAERAAEAIAGVGDAPSGSEPLQVEIPLVDPALRPHRRGRKPKAYVEAERRAAEALAAAQAAAEAAQAPEHADTPAAGAAASEDVAPRDAHALDGAEARDASQSPEDASSQAAPAPEDAADVHPGRGRRAAAAEGKKAAGRKRKKAADEAAAEEAPAAATAEEAPADQAGEAASQEHARRSHAQRRDRGERGGDRGEREGREGRFDRNDRNQGDRNDRRGRQKDRKQRNNRFNVPTEPSLSRDDLSAMKVAELREKARELDIDVTGKKKAQLVEEVYQAAARAEGFRDIEGILEISNEGFGHIRAHGYMQSRDDAFVPANLIRAARLRPGDFIVGTLRPSRQGDKYPGLAKITSVNGLDPEQIRTRPKFSDLTPIYPNERLKMEHGKDSITGRAIDIVAPVGKGQRGLIVSPPKAGKTTILKKICQSIATNNPEVHLICLLVDERPEEVTDMQRSIKGEVVASTFDMPADNHTRVSELVIERAKRLVELGGDVVVVLDSITRLARAYNLAAPASGRILSGGVDSAALYPPKRFLGAARNIENGGSLTILASALIDTGSKMDEVIFEEFKGTGNMELKLDRDLADRRIFPAIDPVASGTRNEDLLIDEQMRPFVWGIRRVLANMNNTERCASSFIKGLKSTNSNEEFLIRSAKRAADLGELR
ncbi:transcription termination factor Rho [Enorma phocaeensis]|uniref:transcription termination factor Rho n=1 Tax=Enorma phocaeensis TaxID=1871019 RepID=UPI00195E45DC|nr:transcription termination factor Rho [Enorma phocaeensis]MBM6952084.1 transcription termination factor Rho [Enorma phocaeensis]